MSRNDTILKSDKNGHFAKFYSKAKRSKMPLWISTSKFQNIRKTTSLVVVVLIIIGDVFSHKLYKFINIHVPDVKVTQNINCIGVIDSYMVCG